MQDEYMNERPRVEVEHLGEKATVILRVFNRTEEREEATAFIYDEYYISAIYRDNLIDDVEANFAVWLNAAQGEAPTSPPTIEQRVEAVESEVASVAEVVDALFGGGE